MWKKEKSLSTAFFKLVFICIYLPYSNIFNSESKLQLKKPKTKQALIHSTRTQYKLRHHRIYYVISLNCVNLFYKKFFKKNLWEKLSEKY